MVKINGLDKLQKKLERMSNNAKNLHGTHDVNFEVLFPDSFMTANTESKNIQDFFDLYDSDITSDNFVDIQDTQEWNAFVKENSKFESWDDMIGTAGQEYAKKRLFEGI